MGMAIGQSGNSGGAVFGCSTDTGGGALLCNEAPAFNNVFQFCIAFIMSPWASGKSQSAHSRFLAAFTMQSVGNMWNLHHLVLKSNGVWNAFCTSGWNYSTVASIAVQCWTNVECIDCIDVRRYARLKCDVDTTFFPS